MIRRLPVRIASVLFAVTAIVLLQAAAAFAAPTLTVATPPPAPGDGRGLPAAPGQDGWWVVPPTLTLTSSEDGTIAITWDGAPHTALPVTAGVAVLWDVPEDGIRMFTAAATNGAGEWSFPRDIVFAVDHVAPSQPQSFLAVLVPASGVSLSWNVSTDPAPSSTMLRYNMYRKIGLPPFSTSDLIGTVNHPGHTFLDTPPGSRDDYIYAVSAVDAAGNESPLSEIDPTPTTITVYRFYNKRNGTHFYTANEDEKNRVIATLGAIYTYEGPAYRAYGTPTGCVMLYRFYNKRNGSHFYTANESEKAYVIAALSSVYTYEGPAYYVSQNPAGTLPVHRFYNRRAGSHFYTANDAERAYVAGTLGSVYTYEGIAFYVLPW